LALSAKIVPAVIPIFYSAKFETWLYKRIFPSVGAKEPLLGFFGKTYSDGSNIKKQTKPPYTIFAIAYRGFWAKSGI
jgi:hypothetical protein